MGEIVEINKNDIIPKRDEVFETQGIPQGKTVPKKILSILDEAIGIFLSSSHPAAIIAEVSVPEFDTTYKGEGMNEKETPLDAVFRKADNLALFAATIGEEVSHKINQLFDVNEFALASMLDSVASASADKTGDVLEKHFYDILKSKSKISSSTGILRYSPGYCGWHISGQKKLFELLHPEEIGIQLLSSYLMKPLKSVTGVIVSGDKKIHIFKDSYPFCAHCKSHSCRDRIRNLMHSKKSNI